MTRPGLGGALLFALAAGCTMPSTPGDDPGDGAQDAPDAGPRADTEHGPRDCCAEGGDGGPAAADGGASVGAAPEPRPDDGPRYPEVVYRASHNSYSGGARGTLREQLEAGVRFLELDVHTDDFAAHGDYRVGHFRPGNEVARGGGNPDGLALRDWLSVIAAWSAAHPDHAPITIGLDLKDDLTDATSFADGNPARLGALLEDVFGPRLFTPAERAGRWPTVEAMRGRVVAVLSGSARTRYGYVRDEGHDPAVAVNARGQVVEVHDSGAGALWYWTGRFVEGGRVEWLRHGRYDSGRSPAVALDDEGYVVEVHQSERADTLWYHVGRIDADGEVTWTDSRRYDDGVRPSIAFLRDGRLREVHASGSTGLAWQWTGTLDRAARTVRFHHNRRADEPRPETATAEAGAYRIGVETSGDAETPEQTLRYSTDTVDGARIAYRRVAFVEAQPGNQPDLERRFFAASASHDGYAARWRAAGEVVRLWGFDEAAAARAVVPTFPATDEPMAGWYERYCRRAGAVR